MSSKKSVLITGASAGFGYDATRALAERGHRVIATMRGLEGKNEEQAKTLNRWAKTHGHDVQTLELDVTNGPSIENAVRAALEPGDIDVLINNAGIGTWGIDEGYTLDQAERVFGVNLFGVMRVNRAVIPHFRTAGQGLIVYISSGLGRIVLPYMAIYTSSKFALEAYAESTSYELAPLGIQSVIVQPGAYGTTFLSNSVLPNHDVVEAYGPSGKSFQSFGAHFEQRHAAGNLGDPAEVVEALIEEVEKPSGERPLRHPVGQDVREGLNAINQSCDQVQNYLLESFGLK